MAEQTTNETQTTQTELPSQTAENGETQQTSLVSQTEEKKEEGTSTEKTSTFTPVEAKDLQFPEGFQADEKLVPDFLAITNKHSLSAEAVNELVALQARATKEASEAGSKLWSDTTEQWKKEVQDDPKIGGQALEGNLRNISKLLDAYGEDAAKVREAFDVTGAGNHPAIVRFMVWAASQLNEGTSVSGSPGAVSGMTLADKMFSNSQGKK